MGQLRPALTLTLPMPPNVAQARGHWRTRYAAVEQWKTRAVVEERGLRGRPERFERVRITAVFYVGRYVQDIDNLVSRLKPVLDLLKRQGLIVDDKAPYLELTGLPTQVREVPRRLVLTLEAA